MKSTARLRHGDRPKHSRRVTLISCAPAHAFHVRQSCEGESACTPAMADAPPRMIESDETRPFHACSLSTEKVTMRTWTSVAKPPPRQVTAQHRDPGALATPAGLVLQVATICALTMPQAMPGGFSNRECTGTGTGRWRWAPRIRRDLLAERKSRAPRPGP